MPFNTAFAESMPTEDDCWIGHDFHTYGTAQFFRELSFINLQAFFFVNGRNVFPSVFCFFRPCLAKYVIMAIVIASTVKARFYDMIPEVFFAFDAIKILDLAWTFIEYSWGFTLLHIFGLIVAGNNLDRWVCSQDHVASSAAYLEVAVKTENIANPLHGKLLLNWYNYSCK